MFMKRYSQLPFRRTNGRDDKSLFFSLPFHKKCFYTLYLSIILLRAMKGKTMRKAKTADCINYKNCFFWQFTCIKYNFYSFSLARLFRVSVTQSTANMRLKKGKKRALINFLTNWISGLSCEIVIQFLSCLWIGVFLLLLLRFHALC